MFVNGVLHVGGSAIAHVVIKALLLLSLLISK